MDQDAWLAQPLAAVFDHLAAPPRLPDWLPEVAAVDADAMQLAGIGATFGLRLHRDGREVPGTGELIAYEPPWSVAYRLTAEPHTYVLRLRCTAAAGGTQVRVRQGDGLTPLAVDLRRIWAPGHEASGEGQGRTARA
jgi:uncharacterized protein YndB with AHSA1/START domain